MKTKLLLGLCLCFITSAALSQSDGEEWDDYFMPGIGYRMYLPKNTDSLGTYQGIVTEFVIYSRAKASKSNWTGPARLKFYGNLSIMNSDRAEAKDIFFGTFGTNLSFEGSVAHRFAIPYFGLEIGGMYQRGFSTTFFSPAAGIQLVSTKRVIWGVQGGYQYTTKFFDEYSGFTLSSTLNVLLWNK